jgi:hypothetical protein
MKIIMDKEELDEFIYEFHERILEIAPERRNRLKTIMLEELQNS